MKKQIAILLLAAVMFTACGSKSKISTGNEPVKNAVYTSEKVSLADYTGLKAEKKNYMITEQAVEDRIQEELMEFADYNSVTRASKSGDYVQTDFKASIDGSPVVQEDKYDFVIGDEEFGPEFDQKLTGVSAGDELNFSLDFAEDFTDADWAGNTVDFEIRVTDIQEQILPEPTDEFLTKNTTYSSYEDFETAMRQSLETSYTAESTQELQENLLQQVIDASSILMYTKEDYKQAEDMVQNVYLSYLDMFGLEDLDDVYEFLEVTEEDVEEEIQATLHRTLIINAIIEKEKFSLTDEDYEEGIRYYMDQTETESREELLQIYGEEEIRRQLLEDMVLNDLVNNATLTEVDTEYEAD